MILRNRLKERRAALGVNQQEMGKLCGVSRQTISLIERGDYSPSVTLALTIAKVCGVTVEEVFICRRKKKMENEQIKKANQKALPKFILFCVIGGLVGGIMGYLVAANGLDAMSGDIKAVVSKYVVLTAPWLMLALAVMLPAVTVPYYRKAKKQLALWDGEDEEISDHIENKLSIVQWFTSGSLIISYFLIAASYAGGITMFENAKNMIGFDVAIVAFLAIMAEGVIIQQKSVDCVKVMNPEKTASVYDMKFQKKWLDTCDEAEKIIVGKCAFKAFNVTNSVCSILAIILAISALMFGIGFFPSFLVCLIWIINVSIYCKECLKYSKSGNKIM